MASPLTVFGKSIFIENNRRALSAFEAAGYEVTKASKGHEGHELYRQRPTDLVITDILMPEMKGLDMLLELTREFPPAKVIVISGAGGEIMP